MPIWPLEYWKVWNGEIDFKVWALLLSQLTILSQKSSKLQNLGFKFWHKTFTVHLQHIIDKRFWFCKSIKNKNKKKKKKNNIEKF